MGDDEIHIGGIHPLGERVRHSLRQRTRMRSPGQDHLRTRHAFIFIDRYEVGEGLAWMDRGRFEADDRFAGIFDELPENGLVVVEGLVLQAGERAHSDDVTVAADDRDRLTQMLRLVAVHHHAHLGLKFPAVAVDIEHYRVHSQIHGRLLAAQAGAQAAVEENQNDRLVPAQILPCERGRLDLLRLLKRLAEVAYVTYVEKTSHNTSFNASMNMSTSALVSVSGARRRIMFLPETPVNMCFS